MSLFKRRNDLRFVKKINYEYLEKLIGTTVNIFKLSIEQTKDNIYMESSDKYYYPGINIISIIEHDDPSYNDIGGGMIDIEQSITTRFYREMLKDLDIYPEIGDVVEWNHNYYEITQVIENQILAGRAQEMDDVWNWSVICRCTLQREKNLNIDGVEKTNDQSEVEFDSFYR